MMRRTSIVILLILILLLLPLYMSYAENAEVLPKGVTSLRLNSKFYFPVDEQYNDNGDTEDIATDFNSKLNSRIFPDLSLIEYAFGMPAGYGSIGNSVVSMKYDFYLYDFYIEHGITDRFSVGVKIPYWDVKNNVNASVNTTNATIGFNSNFGMPGDPFEVPLIPVSIGGIRNNDLATKFVQNYLVQYYGYNRVESWSGNGLSDIEIGGRYQYLNTENWRLAFTSGVRAPTGETDDPDNLMDYALGSGAWALLFYFNNDYAAIKNTILNLTLKYDLYLPDNEVMRVPDDVNQPITPNKEDVHRDIGDIIEINASASYQFLKGSNVYLEYLYGYKFKDSISGNMGFAYDQLEAQSDREEQVVKIGIGYSTIPLYQEKKFPLPLTVDITYRNRFAGKNTLKSDYISIGVAVFF
jgi:hypothetical protein